MHVTKFSFEDDVPEELPDSGLPGLLKHPCIMLLNSFLFLTPSTPGVPRTNNL